MAQHLPWIAIVDDDLSVLKALARLLSTRGLDVRTYPSARHFLTSLPDGHPECLILDLQMPEMTGVELQRHLAQVGIQIPTIVITADGGNELRELCEVNGCIGVSFKTAPGYFTVSCNQRCKAKEPANARSLMKIKLSRT